LSAETYVSITRTSTATATRDLRELLALGAFTKTGKLKGTRYRLRIGSSDWGWENSEGFKVRMRISVGIARHSKRL